MQATVIIICKNDVAGIEKTLQSVVGLGAELMVYDVNNIPGLEEVVQNYDARLYQGEWEGYGHARYKAVTLASHDWILMLHSGETIDEELKRSMNNFDDTQKMVAYKISFKNIFCNKWMRYGENGRYAHIRLGNREYLPLFNGVVQEKTLNSSSVKIKKIKGYILHSPVTDCQEYIKKANKDALIAAVRYHREGKKASSFKLTFSPALSFITNYFFKLGFLDGWEGFVAAKMSAWYTFLKYCRLKELNETQNCLNKIAPNKAPIIGPSTGIQL